MRHVLCFATAAVAGRVLTSLNGTFFSFCSGKSVDEFGKSAVPAEQLLVGAALCNFSVDQDENMVGLWQEAHSVSNQDPRLRSKQNQKMWRFKGCYTLCVHLNRPILAIAGLATLSLRTPFGPMTLSKMC